ncbi:MAG: ATP-binding protein [Lachnospiraceae bacterium]|nr:ATP-binding protein [Lachnospiraceae bacterium]
MDIPNRRFPIGIQTFEKIKEEGYIYVDKTEYVHRLVQNGGQYFLSRPRRFGKSLFLSTLRAYFEGKKELFEGLAVAELEKDDPDAWQEYPVFYIDFNKKNFKADGAIEEVLVSHLTEWEKIYGSEYEKKPLEERFQHLVETAYKKTGKGAVILVDEYDKSLLEAGDSERLEHNKAVFKGFFSTLKSYDRYIKFVFITGVTKFSKVSIFSDLNQLKDISLVRDYSGICGITEGEMKNTFMPEIEALANEDGISTDECISKLRKMYDGYHFSSYAEGVYNPFSLFNALQDKNYGMYWFSTGTPTFLIEKLKSSGFDAKQFTTDEYYEDEASLTDYRIESENPVPLFYQTGYLTIKGFDKEFRSYALGYPNEEVKYGFLKSLTPYYLCDENAASPLDVRNFVKNLRKGDTDSLRERFTALFARLPYPEDERVVEQNFQNVIYIVFMLLGQFTMTEIHSARGRADVIAETDDYIYVFEFKRDKSAEEALQQIEDMGYAKPYAADRRTVLKIGVNFDSKERTIDGWEVRKGHIGKQL